MNIAKAIANLRVSRNLSQNELATMLYVSKGLISKWETGERCPCWKMIEKIASIFEVSPSTIVDKNELIFKELSKCLPDDSNLSVDELVVILNAFLSRLQEIEADIFVHRYYFLEPISDFATLFHLKENHVRSTLSRTRKKLKKYIQEVQHEKHKTA